MEATVTLLGRRKFHIMYIQKRQYVIEIGVSVMEFGEKLKQLRKANHLSQEKLSERIHVSRQAISKWEQGVSQTKRY